MTYRIELIPKTSTMEDIIEPWVCSGRIDNRADGEFVFDEVESHSFSDGMLHIYTDTKSYSYNLSDFYRIKMVFV